MSKTDEKVSIDADSVSTNNDIKKQISIFVNHGGGPIPYMDYIKGKTNNKYSGKQQFVIDSCIELGNIIKKNKPKAIIIFSAHWEEDHPTLIYHESPGMYFDYYNFPKESYQYKYPAKCDLKTTQEIFNLLKENGFKPKLDKKRGWDHGVFIPLMMAYPKGDIPLIQCSLIKVNSNKRSEISLNNIKLGSIISQFRNQNIMVIGSGMTYHNMAGFMDSNSAKYSASFDKWLNKTLITNNNIVSAVNALKEWFKGDSATKCHLREEHLLPLMCCLGSNIDVKALNDIINDKNIDKHKKIPLNCQGKTGKVFEVTCTGFIFS
mmetsp:Transcript_33761/g.41579  ORF Transcript_33761/g.41579 Transcript_33761/m.41579 type:complete len:320 (+) Transcript_33761:19-978(+)